MNLPRLPLFFVAPLVLAACGKTNDAPTPAPSSSAATAPTSSSSAVASASASASASAAASAAPPDADAGPTSCPTGMVLVDGDYCTDLELNCLESWYAKWNDKTICKRFQEPSKCTGKKVKKRYCIDKYEYPNKEGVRPTVMNDFYMAQRLCADAQKRVCTETEWTMACEGPSYKPYPYGYVRDPSVCKGDMSGVEPDPEGFEERDGKKIAFYKFASKKKDVRVAELERLWQGVVSGSEPGCVSDYGVYDMAGNADELAAAESPDSKFDNVTTGGPWRLGTRNQCRPKIYTHNEGFYYYYESFRCCAEPDGAATDPRAPKQIKRGETWKGGKPPIRDSWDGDPFPDPPSK